MATNSWLTGQLQLNGNDWEGLFFVSLLFAFNAEEAMSKLTRKKFHDWLAKYVMSSAGLYFGTQAIYMPYLSWILWETLEGRTIIPYNCLPWFNTTSSLNFHNDCRLHSSYSSRFVPLTPCQILLSLCLNFQPKCWCFFPWILVHLGSWSIADWMFAKMSHSTMFCI